MPIDDPITAAEDLIASEERLRSPVTEGIASLLSSLSIAPADRVTGYLDSRRAENRDLLLKAIRIELERIRRIIDSLSVEHQKYMETDFVELVADGLRKAENVRAHDRVERLGKVLGTAAELGNAVPPEETEEMMRIVLDLDEYDIRVMVHVAEAYPPLGYIQHGRPDQRRLIPEMTDGGYVLTERAHSSCLKLQSFGLAAPRESSMGKPAFHSLRKGIRLLQFLGLATEEQIQNHDRPEK